VGFAVARFYSFDPYYAPYLHRMSDGGLIAPGLILLIVAAVVVAALMVKWPSAAPAGAFLLLVSAVLALAENAGH
jgi:hypothetical protein